MKKAVAKKAEREGNDVYFLKILLYFVIGTIWVKYDGYVVFPLGLAVGLLFTRSDHFVIDRKIEYAVLIIAALMGLSGIGVFISLPTVLAR
jgi:hypothetical protein